MGTNFFTNEKENTLLEKIEGGRTILYGRQNSGEISFIPFGKKTYWNKQYQTASYTKQEYRLMAKGLQLKKISK